ncbi:MAG: PAS domain S-box protein [Gallionella sp.]|jgi:diguanylate cyclase (GGDEF)-like protein/PAS domain S-box-containing protein
MMLRNFFDECPARVPADVLQIEQARLLYAGLPAAIVINSLLALFLAVIQSKVISSGMLLGWLALTGTVLLARAALLLAWQRRGADAKNNPSCWLRRFRIGVISTGMLWGIGAIGLFPAADMDHQVYLAFVFAGLCAGAISSLAVDRVSTLGFLLPVLLPLIVRFGIEGDPASLSMSAMIALFLVFIALNALRGGRSLHGNIQLRIKAEEQEQLLRLSQERLEQAQRSAHIGNWELDLVGNRLYWSDEIYRIFGIEPAGFEPSYAAFLDAIHPDDRDAVNLAYTRSLETREPYEITHRLVMNGGQIKWVTERCDSFFDAEGKPTRSAGTVQDVTERIQFEQKLQESERRYHFLFENNPMPMWIFTEDRLEFLEVNNRAVEHYGFTREEFSRMTLRDIRPAEYMQALDQALSDSPDGVVSIETRHKKKDGTPINVRVCTMPMAYGDGHARIALAQDITEQKRVEAEREWQIRNQQALLNAIQESTFLMDKDGTMLVINEVGAQRLNTTPDELVGKNVYDILPPELALARRAKFEHIARTGIPETFEDERNGRRLLSTIYPVHDTNGQVSRFSIYAADITQQRRDQAIKDLFSAINQKVLSGMPLSDVLHFICIEAARLFDLNLIWLGRKEADGSVNILTHAGPAAGYVDGLRRIGVRWDDTPQGRGATGTAIRSGQVQVLSPSHPGFKVWRDLALEYNFQSMVGIPLLIRGEVYGAFTLYSGKPDTFSTAFTDLLIGISTRISVAVEAAMDHQQIRLLSSALAAAGNGIMITDRRGVIQWVNPAFVRLSGYGKEELIGQVPQLLNSGQQAQGYYQDMWERISKGETWCSETVERAKSGDFYTVSQTITPMMDENGEIAHFIAIHEDITAQKKTQERIAYMAHYDALTGLPNRALFYDRLRHALSMARRNHGGMALLFMDLDGFKSVNDTLGHQAGDLLLTGVAERLQQCIRESDTVSRLGGDEFTVILNDAHEQHSVAKIAEKIIEAIAEPFDLDGNEVRIGVSIGIARYSEEADGEDELVKHADQAMYDAKSAGKNTYKFGSAR